MWLTAQAMTFDMPLMQQKLKKNLAGSQKKLLNRAFVKPFNGILKIHSGQNTCKVEVINSGLIKTTVSAQTNMKILLLGKNGQVGWELQRALAPLGHVIALDRNVSTDVAGAEGIELCGDLSNLTSLEASILAIKPDVIVNAAAYTAVDKAESEIELATLINSGAVELLAKLCEQLNALLVHYSTDYVFNGSGSIPWLENQQTEPLNVYGKTKVSGEQAIEKSGCQYLIFRTSWVYGSKGNNFAKTMLRLASDRDSLSVIGDQKGTPTSAELIADVTAHAIPFVLRDESASGLYHLAAAGETSWYEYAKYVIEQAQSMGQLLQVSQIKQIPTSEYPTPAIRPLNSRLNCDKLRDTFGLHLSHWKSGVDRMLQEI